MKDTESDKFVASHDPIGGMIDVSAMMPSSSGSVIMTRKPRRDGWNLNPLQDDGAGDLNDPFSRALGQNPNGWLSSSQAPTNNSSRLKNSSDRVWGRAQQDDAGMFRRFDDSMYGSGQASDSLSSRFGADNQREGSQPRESNRLNRDAANQGDGTFWSKIFNHESGASEHFAFSRADSSGQADQAPVSAFSDRYKLAATAGLGSGAESSGNSLAPSFSSGTFYTPTIGHSLRDSGQTGLIPGLTMAQDPQIPHNWASRSFFTKPSESRADRYGIHDRPAVLAMPKRPNDPQ